VTQKKSSNTVGERTEEAVDSRSRVSWGYLRDLFCETEKRVVLGMDEKGRGAPMKSKKKGGGFWGGGGLVLGGGVVETPNKK